ncbi:MAG: hypothetical protein ABI950_09250 [Solirubrobacteraceae bacterium]
MGAHSPHLHLGRRLTAVLALVLAPCLSCMASLAAAAGTPTPAPLWDAYPLDAGPQTSTLARPAPPGDPLAELGPTPRVRSTVAASPPARAPKGSDAPVQTLLSPVTALFGASLVALAWLWISQVLRWRRDRIRDSHG